MATTWVPCLMTHGKALNNSSRSVRIPVAKWHSHVISCFATVLHGSEIWGPVIK